MVDRLVSKKLITRRERNDDRRFQSIALTAAGRRLIPQLAAMADQNDVEFFHPLSTRERAALIRNDEKAGADTQPAGTTKRVKEKKR